MAVFRYKAANSAGDVETGDMEAGDQAFVVQRLQSQGYIPIRIEEADAGTGASRSWEPFSLFRKSRITQDQLAVITREMSTLLRAGLALDRAVEILINLAESEPIRALLSKLRDDVRGGTALSKAMDAHPQVFGRFYVSMIKAGEAGGTLGVVLGRLTEFLDQSKELKETVKSALIYPAILVLTSFISVTLLLVFVVPQFTEMFRESGKTLPLPTQIVVASGEFLRHYWWSLLAAGFPLYRFFKWQMGHPASRLRWDRRFLRMPLVGDLITKIEISRFSRTLGTLLTNGIQLLPALSIVKETVGNTAIADGLNAVRDKLKEGQGFGKPLMEHGYYPKLAVHMVMVGEETGQLDEMLTRIADVYDREVQLSIKRLLSMLEPVMILGLGLTIGGIIMSILLAILEVNSLAG